MRDFLSALDDRLAVSVHQAVAELKIVRPEDRVEARASTSAAAPIPLVRRLLPGLALASAASAAAAVFVIATPVTQAAEGLPILKAEPIDQSALKAQVNLSGETLDYRRARPLGASTGGYAVRSMDGRRICIIVPDRSIPGTYGSGCGAVTTVEEEGLVLEAVGDLGTDPRATDLVTMILPVGASAVRLQRDGRLTAPPVRSGVVSFELRGPATLLYQRRGAAVAHTYDGPFPKTAKYQVDCGGGKTRVVVDPPMIKGKNGAPAYLDSARVCR